MKIQVPYWFAKTVFLSMAVIKVWKALITFLVDFIKSPRSEKLQTAEYWNILAEKIIDKEIEKLSKKPLFKQLEEYHSVT